MANIPALAGYQNANGEGALAKFGPSDVLTDPNGNPLLTGAPSGGVVVPFDTPILLMAYNNTLYNGAAQGAVWNYSNQWLFAGILDLTALTTSPIPAGAKAVVLMACVNLWNTVGGAARVGHVYAAKTYGQVTVGAQAPLSSAYHLAGVGAGSGGGDYDSNTGCKIVNFDGDRQVAVSAYSNNNPNNYFWYINAEGYVI